MEEKIPWWRWSLCSCMNKYHVTPPTSLSPPLSVYLFLVSLLLVSSRAVSCLSLPWYVASPRLLPAVNDGSLSSCGFRPKLIDATCGKPPPLAFNGPLFSVAFSILLLTSDSFPASDLSSSRSTPTLDTTMAAKAIPAHLRAAANEALGSFEGKHHGKSQSHMVSRQSAEHVAPAFIWYLRERVVPASFWELPAACLPAAATATAAQLPPARALQSAFYSHLGPHLSSQS